jgi:hypothetical protein
MSSNFWHSSHARYHLHPRSRLSTARATDLRYCTPRQHYCLGIWFANLIQKLGKRLLLRQIPIATATVFFRRFYLKNSICETNPYLVLAACVFVAAKVEETPVHIKSVVTEAKLVFAGECGVLEGLPGLFGLHAMSPCSAWLPMTLLPTLMARIQLTPWFLLLHKSPQIAHPVYLSDPLPLLRYTPR